MTSHLDSHTTTDVKPEMIPGVLTGNGIPHDEYNIRGIAHVRTNSKDDIFMQRRLLIDKAHTVLDIFQFTHMVLIYMASSTSVQIEKTTISCKDDCTLTKHTGPCTYSARDFEIPLCHTPPLRSFFILMEFLPNAAKMQ